MEKMKAVIYEKFGPPEVLMIRERDKPVPGDNEVLVKVRATTVNAADCNVRGFSYIPPGLGFLARMMMGFGKPKISIPGSALAGDVEAVGKDVKLFKPGDAVYGTGPEMGAYAEYACRPEEGALALKPKELSYEEAAALPYGALTALYFLKDKANVGTGQKVLVVGASGGVGVFAVQIAKYFGAGVTGVCSSANADLVRSLGADHVIDYTKEDLTGYGEKWDIIIDIVVGKTSFSRYRKVINPYGYYLAVAGGLGDMLQMVRTSLSGSKKVIFGGGTACEKKENMLILNKMVEEGKLKPVIDKNFSLEQIVEAHRYAESGRKRGSVAVTV